MAAGFTDLLGVSHRASVNWLEHDRKAEKTVRRESPRPLGPLPKHVTRLIRPDGSTPLIDWTRDEDVRIVIDDLVNAGWVIIKAVAIPWKPNITINPDIVMNNQFPTAIRRVAIRGKIWAVIGYNTVCVSPNGETFQSDAFLAESLQQLFGFRCVHIGGEKDTKWSIEVRIAENRVLSDKKRTLTASGTDIFLSNGWLPTAMSPKFAEAELMQVSYLWYDIDKEHVKYVLDPSEVQKWLFVS